MRMEDINVFLKENEEIKQKIERIAKNYTLADFVKVTESVYGYLYENVSLDFVSGCICNIRKSHLRLNVESVEQRITNEYLELLMELLKAKDKVDKVFYIVAYHYLSMLKQVGYELTGYNNDRAPFSFIGNELSPHAMREIREMKKLRENVRFDITKSLSEEDLIYYNKVYRDCGYFHHATKHFSLIDEYVGFSYIIGEFYFDQEFEKALKLFIFEYRAIFADERISYYMYQEKIDKIINGLMDLK